MKFLCVPCDQPMRTSKTALDDGSISVVYACPACGYEIAMLTNPHETQLVRSLGVRIGPAQEGEDGAAAGDAPRCPFPSMLQSAAEAAAPPAGGIRWTAAASARLQTIPSFVRDMARQGIEKFAAEQGYDEVDEIVLDEARSRFGM